MVYCFHGGQASPYQYPDSHASNSFLELKDSTLIPFNEHHTFEDVLDLNKLGFELDTGYYRILYIDPDFGIMDQEKIYLSANEDENYFHISFEFLVCWLQTPYSYLHFKNGTNELMHDYCRNIDTIIARAANKDLTFEINGIISDSVSIEIANTRVDVIYDRLSSAGIPANRLVKNYNATVDTTLGFGKCMCFTARFPSK